MNRRIQFRYRLAAPEEFCWRAEPEEFPAQPYRSEFERDRDRILYSRAFRRLSGKTQVFLPTSHDHVRTRLTHTLEVAQIAALICRHLNLDEMLAQAISLGHDIGHTPFGHVGERTLNHIMQDCDHLADFQSKMSPQDKGFKHNLQALRVLCDLEHLYGRRGLNLTGFTLWGICHHSPTQWGKCSYQGGKHLCYLHRNPKPCVAQNGPSTQFYDQYFGLACIKGTRAPAWSFEAGAVRIADRIAQRHHDIEDGILMKLFDPDEVTEKLKYLLGSYLDQEDRTLMQKLCTMNRDGSAFCSYVSKLLVGTLTKRVIESSMEALERFVRGWNIRSRKDFEKAFPQIQVAEVVSVIDFSPDLKEADGELETFLKNRMLNSFEVQRMDGKGRFVIRSLFKAYLTNPRQLHNRTITYVFRIYEEEGRGETYASDTGQGGKIDRTWPNVTPRKIGEYRNKIDSPEMNSNTRFQVALLRGICDHIAGMTDNFAMAEYEKLYG